MGEGDEAGQQGQAVLVADGGGKGQLLGARLGRLGARVDPADSGALAPAQAGGALRADACGGGADVSGIMEPKDFAPLSAIHGGGLDDGIGLGAAASDALKIIHASEAGQGAERARTRGWRRPPQTRAGEAA